MSEPWRRMRAVVEHCESPRTTVLSWVEREGLPHVVVSGGRKVRGKKRRQRRILLYHAEQKRKLQDEMGQDPYLDAGA